MSTAAYVLAGVIGAGSLILIGGVWLLVKDNRAYRRRGGGR